MRRVTIGALAAALYLGLAVAVLNGVDQRITARLASELRHRQGQLDDRRRTS